MQTGELSVLDDSQQRVATFFFERAARIPRQFQHLTGEEAFWQLFLSGIACRDFFFFFARPTVAQCVQRTDDEAITQAIC